MKTECARSILLRALREDLPRFLGLAAVILLVTLSSLLPPQLLKRLIDDCLIGGERGALWPMALLYAGSFFLSGGLDFLKGLLLTRAGQRLVRAVRLAMMNKLSRVEPGYFSAAAPGETASHFLADVENISVLFTDGVASLLIDCLKIVGIVASVWLFSARLGAFVLCLLPFLYLMTRAFRRRILKAQKENLVQLSRVNELISESLVNLRMIKSFHKEAYLLGRYGRVLDENYKTMNRVNILDGAYSPIIQVVTALFTAFVFYSAGGGGGAVGVSLGALAATVQLVANLFAPIDSLGTELQSIQKGAAGLKGVDGFLSLPEMDIELIYPEEGWLLEGATLRIEHLSFAYAGGEEVLKDLSFTVRPGENLCVTGRTGVGKTTLFHLTAGLLAPTKGRVTLNGVETCRLDPALKRRIFGFVEQSFSFIKGSVREQITLGDDSISLDRVREVLRFVGLDDFVARLPEGCDTDAGDGALFSQGQKQLLCIARALAADPVVLLLDEVTSSLDAVTEENVVSVLKRLRGRRTVLSISHRASSAMDSDRIIHIENGRIAEDAAQTVKRNCDDG